MRSRLVLIATLATIALLTANLSFAAEIGKLAWLEGQWRGRPQDSKTKIDLYYSNPHDGLIVGAMKTSPVDREVFWELLTINQADDGPLRMTGLLYGSAKVDYVAETVSENSVVFKGNTANGPQKITLKKLNDDSISETIELIDRQGRPKKTAFIFQRK